MTLQVGDPPQKYMVDEPLMVDGGELHPFVGWFRVPQDLTVVATRISDDGSIGGYVPGCGVRPWVISTHNGGGLQTGELNGG